MLSLFHQILTFTTRKRREHLRRGTLYDVGNKLNTFFLHEINRLFIIKKKRKKQLASLRQIELETTNANLEVDI